MLSRSTLCYISEITVLVPPQTMEMCSWRHLSHPSGGRAASITSSPGSVGRWSNVSMLDSHLNNIQFSGLSGFASAEQCMEADPRHVANPDLCLTGHIRGVRLAFRHFCSWRKITDKAVDSYHGSEFSGMPGARLHIYGVVFHSRINSSPP